MGSIKILQMDKEGVEDRVYRLHYNSSQKRTDTFSAVSSTDIINSNFSHHSSGVLQRLLSQSCASGTPASCHKHFTPKCMSASTLVKLSACLLAHS
jgi:hypothetical protein